MTRMSSETRHIVILLEIKDTHTIAPLFPPHVFLSRLIFFFHNTMQMIYVCSVSSTLL